ncbi:hypothetical protein RhiirA5_425826 [Rhizophagus irregularis]|uniref:Uncharacterized protein n=1 Tax=Rhizophagus irregularis TaxID=588596 RepID=A0A2N0P5I9_9GLOM|nr:hypothetical protein RhiirA5_425826 [Rhizophagus irregularis]
MKIFFNGLRSGFPSKSHFKSHFLLLTLQFKFANHTGTELRDRIEKLEWRAECNLAENSRRDGVVFKLKNEVEKLRHDIDELKKNQNLRKIVNSRPDAPR